MPGYEIFGGERGRNVPAVALHLDVFAQHVESQLLCKRQVKDQGLVRGRRVNAIWPKALHRGPTLNITDKALPVYLFTSRSMFYIKLQGRNPDKVNKIYRVFNADVSVSPDPACRSGTGIRH